VTEKATTWTPEARQKMRLMRLGEKNPNWKGNNVKEMEGRARARRWFNCPKGSEIHHIDGNPLNNDPSNIEFLTRKDHMTTDGRLNELKKKRFDPTGHKYSEETKKKHSDIANQRKRDCFGRFGNPDLPMDVEKTRQIYVELSKKRNRDSHGHFI